MLEASTDIVNVKLPPSQIVCGEFGVWLRMLTGLQLAEFTVIIFELLTMLLQLDTFFTDVIVIFVVPAFVREPV